MHTGDSCPSTSTAAATTASVNPRARATADRALAQGLLRPELAEDLLGVLAHGTEGDAR